LDWVTNDGDQVTKTHPGLALLKGSNQYFVAYMYQSAATQMAIGNDGVRAATLSLAGASVGPALTLLGEVSSTTSSVSSCTDSWLTPNAKYPANAGPWCAADAFGFEAGGVSVASDGMASAYATWSSRAGIFYPDPSNPSRGMGSNYSLLYGAKYTP
jgi:hypothetical protein